MGLGSDRPGSHQDSASRGYMTFIDHDSDDREGWVLMIVGKMEVPMARMPT